MNALDAKLTQMGLHRPETPTVAPQGTEGDTNNYPIEVYPEKHDTRRDTLNLLRNPARLSRLWYNGHLTCAWAELCGDAPDSTGKFLLEEGVLTPEAPYIGINKNPAIIAANQEAFATAEGKTRWLCGQAEHLVLDLDNPDLRGVGVLVFDTEYSPSNTNLEAILMPVLAFAKAQHGRLGQFLLVINQTLRGSRGLALEAGCRQYEAILREHCGIKAIPESAYTIYTSRVARMRVLRLTFGW